MKFTRNQIRIMSVLAIVTVVLMVGVIFVPYLSAYGTGGGDIPTDQAPVVEPHDKFRTARPAFNENLFWETNLGSSGFDTAENVFAVENKIFIVGGIGQNDYDFEEADSCETFLTVLSSNGTPLSHCFFEGTLIRSVLFNDKILIFTKVGNVIHATYTDFEGITVKNQALPFDKNHELLDVIDDYERNILCLILRITNESTGVLQLKAVELTANLETEDSALLTHAYNLEYVNAYRHADGYVIAANVRTPVSAAMLIYEWKNGVSFLNVYECSLTGRKFRAETFVPYSGGYAAAIIDDTNIPDILLISYTFSPTGLSLLKLNETVSLNIFCDNRFYYVYALSAAGLGSLKQFDLDFKASAAYGTFNFYTEINAFKATASQTYFAGIKSSTSAVCVIDNSSSSVFETTFATEKEKVAFIIPYDGYLIVIAHSTAKSIDVGGNFGGQDIWITKLRF